MAHFKFTRRNVRRLCVTMALIAPIIYLFGSLFTGLNGAHGQQIFADGEETSQKSYDDLMEVENFSYGAFDWTNEHGTRVGFSLGSYDLYLGSSNFGLSFYCSSGVGVYSSIGDSYNYGLGFPSSSLYMSVILGLYDDGTINEFYVDDFLFDTHSYFCFYCVYDDIVTNFSAFVIDSDDILFGYHYYDGVWSRLALSDILGNEILSHNIYFDDGAHLPEGVSWNDELRSYFVPKVKALDTQTYSDYVFGQFFARDNFVSKIGEDSISETPHGFAPFGSLFRYIDDNALHMGDTQVGLMAYGYMYWCAHVLLFDVLFMMTTFFISFIERVGDRLGGNE